MSSTTPSHEKIEDGLPSGSSLDGRSYVEAYPDVDEKKLVRKLDLHLIPGVTILYLLSFLDRANVGNAKLEGLTRDLRMSEADYNTSLTMFFVGYILFEVFWNLVLKRVGPKLWLPAVTFVWGVVTTLQGVTVYSGGSSGVAGFLVVRFFLGVAEGALFPGVVFLLSMWYKRHERQYRIALFFSAASLAGAFGGILAYGIGHMRGLAGLSGWVGSPSASGAVLTLAEVDLYHRRHPGFWFIPDWPHKAQFVDSNERAYIKARLQADSDATQNEGFTWGNVLDALKDPKVWLYNLGFHTMSLPLYTLSLFLPSIIAALGYTASNAQLLTIPPYVLATILTFTYAVWSERVGKRAPFIIVSCITAIIGYIILLSNENPTRRPGVSYVGMFFCAAGIYPAVALTLSWPAVNVSGQTKRATAGGAQITIGNLGAIIGTQIYRAENKPRYVVGHAVALAYLVGNILVTTTLWIYLNRLNRQRDEAERRAGKEWDGVWRGDDDVHWRFQT